MNEPRILTQATKERVALVLAVACDGYLCAQGDEPPTYSFRKRLTASGVVTVHIQCDGCGRSRSGALKRADFAHWQDFPLWDDELPERHRSRIEEFHDASRSARAAEAQGAGEKAFEELARRRENYREWLAISPEWKALRERVLYRSARLCEACLNANARDVHHLTYRLGRLPPAWELRAVCRPCHDRLHDWTGGEE